MSFTDRTSNIFNIIKTTYNAGTLKTARRLERTSIAQVRYKQHLHYLHRCKERKFLPRFLQSRPPLDHPKAWDIAIKAGWSYLRIVIGKCHYKLKYLNHEQNTVRADAERTLSTGHFNTLLAQIEKRCIYEQHVIEKRHQQKLGKSETDQHETAKKKWVINASKRNLNEVEISVLRKGSNFALTPKSIPTKNILASVEQGISKFTGEVQKDVRQKVTSALKKARPPAKQNLTCV